MRAVTIRDLRLHWPSIEARLRKSEALTVTRDGQPVATLSAYVAKQNTAKLASFSVEEHMRWLNATWRGKKQPPPSDAMLAQERGEK